MTHPSPIRLAAEQLEARDLLSTYDLGDAAQFNALFLSEMIASNSDAEGRVAVGGHASFANYGIGDKLPPDNTRDDLIVGDNLEFVNGQVFGGNIVYGGVGQLQSVGTPNGSTRQQADVLPFADIQQDLTGKSTSWGGEAPNGSTSARYSNLNLRGTNPQLDAFTVTPGQLAAAKTICVVVPFGATVLINVPGDSATIQNLGLRLRGTDAAHMLWNFPDASELTVSGVGLKGSVLAPAAHLDFNNGSITGAVIANSMAGNGQFNLTAVNLHIAFPPKTATLSGMVFSDDNANDQLDPNESGIGTVEVDLTGRDSLGRMVNFTTITQDDGTFSFGPMAPGTFTIRVIPPQRYSGSTLDGIPGTANAVPDGLAGVNLVKTIVLGDGDAGLDYLLPLTPDPH